MSGCGALDHLRGGAITEATVASSTIMASVIRDSVIENLASIDAASAEVIADAIAALPPDKLEALAKAIAAAMPKDEAASGNAPKTSTEDWLPTTLYGTRAAVLGEPDDWISFQGKVVPVYKESTGG